MSWYIPEACPHVGADSGTLVSNFVHGTTTCLLPGDYTFVAWDSHGDGWEGGTFDVFVEGSAAPLIAATEVDGSGLQKRFTVPRAFGQYIVQLSPGVPRITAVKASTGTGTSQALYELDDTSTADQQWVLDDGSDLDALELELEAPGILGETLTVVARESTGTRLVMRYDFRQVQTQYRIPVPVDCGPLGHRDVDIARCYHAHGGTCDLRCLPGFTGSPAAVCSAGGRWTYSGSCDSVAPGYVMGSNFEGQLGLSAKADANRPFPLTAPNAEPISAFVLGHSHSAFAAGGQWYVMGLHKDGQLGRASPGRHTAAPVPLDAPNGRAITAVAMGFAHSAFLAGGHCYVMGSNAFGELGVGSLEQVDQGMRSVVGISVTPPPPPALTL